MFNSKLKAELQQCQEQLLAQQGFFDAVHGSVATITFTPDGTVLAANDLFLNVVGFSAPEVIGQHHRLFCDKQYAQSSAYQQFWADFETGALPYRGVPALQQTGRGDLAGGDLLSRQVAGCW